MKLGMQVRDVRTNQRGMLCGYSGLNYSMAILKRDGKVFVVGRKWIKRVMNGTQ